ncbi:MAG: hypothetical protein KBD26_04190 [Candidatus Pacebacteria bacterium]|nr:hypothetical protein [Candidatus Paceibacterota bacterium]
MIFGKESEKTEERIVYELSSQAMTGPDLIEYFKDVPNPPSKESLYRILRQLQKDEVIYKNKSLYTLNQIWLRRMRLFIDEHLKSETMNLFDMQDGDKITYKFKNPNLMGIYWAHSGHVILENHNPKIPVLIYHPHEWLIHARTHSENYFLNGFKKRGQLGLFAIGGDTDLDKTFQKNWNSKYLEIGTKININAGLNTHINVIGDYVFIITTEKSFGEKLDKIFQDNKSMTPTALYELKKLTEQNYKTKLVLMKSKKEAEKWKKRFKKYFVTGKNYKW